MARYIDADRLLACLEEYGGGEPVAFVTMRQLKNAISFVEDTLPANVVLPPEREVERLEKALAAKDAEYDQALQDKSRECNMAIDKICIAHREEIRALQEKHEQELAKAKSEREIEIVSESFVAAMADWDKRAKRFVQIQYAKTATEICYEIKKEISAALHNNYRVRGELDASEELYYIVNGKISALRGIEGFVEELKKKYTNI